MTDQLKQFQGTVLEQGYGIVGKSVMKDRNIHGMAKALYAYLCTYGNAAYPKRELICADLNVNKDTYTKYLNQLVEFGYITIEKTKNGTKFANNIYHINQIKVPCPKKQDTEKNDHSPCPNFSDTKPSDTKNSDINNTSSNNTNLNKTTTNKKSVVVFSSATQKETDVEKEVILKAEICGIKKQTIKKYINQQGLDNVLTQINNLDNAIIEGNKNGNPIANPGAWLYTALKEGFIDTKAIQKAKSKEKADTIKKAAEEALFSDNKETTTLDPSSPFTKIAERLGVLKAM